MDQDSTWYVGRPQPRRLRVRWGPSPSPERGRSLLPIFGPFLLWPNGWMHQDATWYGGRPQPRGLCVRLGPSPLSQKGGGGVQERSPQFSAHVYCGQTAGCTKMALSIEAGFGPEHIVIDGDPVPSPKKGAEPPHFCHLVWR